MFALHTCVRVIAERTRQAELFTFWNKKKRAFSCGVVYEWHIFVNLDCLLQKEYYCSHLKIDQTNDPECRFNLTKNNDAYPQLFPVYFWGKKNICLCFHEPFMLMEGSWAWRIAPHRPLQRCMSLGNPPQPPRYMPILSFLRLRNKDAWWKTGFFPIPLFLLIFQ